MLPKHDSATYPWSLQLCTIYRNSSMCSNKLCRCLHICPNWLAGYCKAQTNCRMAHSTLTLHNIQVLQHYMPKLSKDCEFRRHKCILSAFVRPCTHNWGGKCRVGPAKCPNLHCCPATARGRPCPRADQCKLGHQLDRAVFKRRNINIPDGWEDVQIAWRFIVISDPYNAAMLRQAHACHCRRCQPPDAGDAADSRAESLASNTDERSSIDDLDIDLDDVASSSGDFVDDFAAEKTGADVEGAVGGGDSSFNEDNMMVANDLNYLDNMESPMSTMREPRNIAGPYEEKPEPYKDALDFENVFRHIRQAPLLTLDNVLKFLLSSEGSASVADFLSHFALQSSFPLDQWLSDQPAEQLILSRGRLNAYPRVRICQFYNGVKKSCRNVECPRLHVCLWWLADPNGSVHKGHCGLAHGLSDAHNKEVLSQLGLAGSDSEKICGLLRASHPTVCSDYNSDAGCRRSSCSDIHICNNVTHRENKISKQLCPCHRSHQLEPPDKDPETFAKLARFGLDSDEKLSFVVRSFLIPAPLMNRLSSMASAQAAPAAAAQALPTRAEPVPPPLPDVSDRGLKLRTVYAALIRRCGQATPSELLTELQLPADFPLENWRDSIDEQLKPVQSMIDIYKAADSGRIVSVNAFRRFRICPMHNGAPNSCLKADCCQLHLCLWFLADPDGKVHDKSSCRLCHDLTGRNHRIRSALGIADGLRQGEVLDLLRACHPKVCSDYNSDSGCQRSECPDIHLCNNVTYRNCGRCSCHRQHTLIIDESNKNKLFPFDMDSLNPGHVLRAFLVPAPLCCTAPVKDRHPSLQGSSKAPPSLPAFGSATGGPPPVPPLMRGPQQQHPMGRPIGEIQSGGPPHLRGPHPVYMNLQSNRQKKLAASSVPNIANLRLPGGSVASNSAKTFQQRHLKQRQAAVAPSQVAAAAAAVPPPPAAAAAPSKPPPAAAAAPSKPPPAAAAAPSKPPPAAAAAPSKPPPAAAAAPSKPPPAAASAPSETLCEEFLRHECYEQSCPRRHSRHKLPYLWQWRAARWPSNKWKDADPVLNIQLEEAFCQPDRSEFVTTASGSDSEFVAEFPGQLTMFFGPGPMEIRTTSGASGSLRCLRTDSRVVLRQPLATNWRWFFLSGGAWIPVDNLHEPGLNDQLEAALCRGVSSISVGDFNCDVSQLLVTVRGPGGVNQKLPLRRRPTFRTLLTSAPMQPPLPSSPRPLFQFQPRPNFQQPPPHGGSYLFSRPGYPPNPR